MVRQQIIGIVNVSLPLLIVYAIYPAFLVTLPGQIACAVGVGIYLLVLSYKSLLQLTRTLQFSPTGEYKNQFDALIRSCHLDPTHIVVKYAYTNEVMTMTASNTVIIDPIVWHGIVQDPAAMQVGQIFKVHIEPNLTQLQKARLTAMYRLLTEQSQRFIFKHELGHVASYFSYKKLAIIFTIGCLMSLSGIFTAMFMLQFHGLIAIISGMVVAGIIDLFLTYVCNITFKLYAEKAADQFAVRYSSEEDVRAAAEFFKAYQQFLDDNKSSSAVISKVPSALHGYQHGTDRAAYLFKLLADKK